MKKFAPALLIILLPLLYSCAGKSDQQAQPAPTETITAQKNGANWVGSPIDTGIKDSLIVHAKGPNDVLRLQFVSVRTTTFTTFDSNTYYYTTNANGKVVNKFKIDTT